MIDTTVIVVIGGGAVDDDRLPLALGHYGHKARSLAGWPPGETLLEQRREPFRTVQGAHGQCQFRQLLGGDGNGRLIAFR